MTDDKLAFAPLTSKTVSIEDSRKGLEDERKTPSVQNGLQISVPLGMRDRLEKDFE
jgi:hypothetical protein